MEPLMESFVGFLGGAALGGALLGWPGAVCGGLCGSWLGFSVYLNRKNK